MLHVRPIIPSSTIKTLASDFLPLWRNPTWILVTNCVVRDPSSSFRTLCPHCFQEDTPAFQPNLFDFKSPDTIPTPVELTYFQFVAPGPCGRAHHSIYAGRCPACDNVLWMMGPCYITPWTTEQVESISEGQEQDLSSFTPGE